MHNESNEEFLSRISKPLDEKVEKDTANLSSLNAPIWQSAFDNFWKQFMELKEDGLYEQKLRKLPTREDVDAITNKVKRIIQKEPWGDKLAGIEVRLFFDKEKL